MAHRLRGLNAFDRHKQLMHEYMSYYGGQLPDLPVQHLVKTDFDTLRETYRFIRKEDDDVSSSAWEINLAHKYYAKLFKEYAIIDLSRYKEGKFGMRWRTSREVVAGKGQFICGTKGCEEKQGLESFEVPFAYEEANKQKQALVKVRLCQEHGMQLNYKKNRDLLEVQGKAKRKRARSTSFDESQKVEMRRRQGKKMSPNDNLDVDKQRLQQGLPDNAKGVPRLQHDVSKLHAEGKIESEAEKFLAQLLV